MPPKPNNSFSGQPGPHLALFASIAALLLIGSMAKTGHAVVVLKKGSPKPIMGYLVRHDDRGVTVRENLPDGKYRDEVIARDQIDELLITVSPERLAALDPKEPRLYREYAEELAEKHRDPEARDAAIRLYHITAALGDAQLRRGALLGLIALARSPAEERKFRAAAYLYDADHDPKLLASPADVKLDRASAVKEPLAELLITLRLARQGKGAQAKAGLERPGVRAQLEAMSGVLTTDEFQKACAAKQLNSEQLAAILKAEVAIERAVSDTAADVSLIQPTTWTSAMKAGGLSPLPSLALESLTEFDPRACVFRDGKWEAP